MTDNNWFKTNLSERSFTSVFPLSIDITPYYFEKISFLEAATNTAKKIVNSFDKLYLSYSGGLDSDFILKTFIENKLPIIPIIIDTPFNKNELKYAYDQCKNLNIKPEILTYSEKDIIDQLKIRSVDRGFFSILGAIPLLLCDNVNKVGGSLLTGYGDPFTITPGINDNRSLSTILEFSEWDYYLDSYDNRHPSGFFTYNIQLFYAMINEISYNTSVQHAKCALYNMKFNEKMFWDEKFYEIFREICNREIVYSCFYDKEAIVKRIC